MHKIVAKATKVGSLYQFDYKPSYEHANDTEKSDTKENILHKCYGHLGVGGLYKLAHKNLVNSFNFLCISLLYTSAGWYQKK